MTTKDEQFARDLARMLLRNPDQPTYSRVVQGVVESVAIDGTLAAYLSGDTTLPVGGLKYMDWYEPRVGDTIFILKTGPDLLVMGDIQRLLDPSYFESPKYIGITAGAPNFVPGWSNYGTGFGNARYWKDPYGWVYLNGIIKKTSGAVGDSLFQLPTGYRPPYTWRFFQNHNSGLGQIDVSGDGTIRISSSTTAINTAFVSLDGIVFPATAAYPWAERKDWIVMNMINGTWNTVDAAGFPALTIREDGLVHVRGIISPPGTQLVMSTLPQDACSTWSMTFLLPGYLNPNAVVCRMDVRRGDIFTQIFNGATQVGIDPMMWWNSWRETDWILPSLTNGWVQFDNTQNYPPAGYFKDQTGVVWLRGLIKNGTLGQAAFNLPAGYRPATNESMVFAAETGNAAGRIDVYFSGDVTPQASQNSFVELSNIHFKAGA